MTEVLPDLVRRSVDIIVANQSPTGAFLASPTFSQYRYSWLRDGAFIAWALDLVGEHRAAARFHDWVAGVILGRSDELRRASEAAREGGAPARSDCLHCRYGVDGSAAPGDWPTFQLDGPGIWLWALGEHVARGGDLTSRRADGARLAADYLDALWTLPSYDAWEEGGEYVHTGTLGAIATGLGAAAGLVAAAGPGAPSGDLGSAPDRYRSTAARIDRRLHEDFAAQGYFSKWVGNPAVDAALLWLGFPYRMLPLDDPLFAATVERIEKDLVGPDGGVYRYRDDTYYGGGEWVLLTASLGLLYAIRANVGDRDRALRALHWIEAQADADGQLPEQVDAHALHSEWIEEWRQRWGASARPLLWSHAMYLALAHHLEVPG